MPLPVTKKPKYEATFPEACLKRTNQTALKADGRGPLMPILMRVINDPKVEAACKQYDFKLSLNTLYSILHSYCKYGAKRITEGAEHFLFPSLGVFRKRIHDHSKNAEINKTLKGTANRKANRKLCLDYFKAFDPKKFERMVELKKKQWDLK